MSNDTASTVEQLDLNIERSRQVIERSQALERLFENRDFRELVLEGYFKDEAVRLVMLKAAPSMQAPERQQAIIGAIDAIGALHSYFNTIVQQASLAGRAIEIDEQTREELLSEEEVGY